MASHALCSVLVLFAQLELVIAFRQTQSSSTSTSAVSSQRSHTLPAQVDVLQVQAFPKADTPSISLHGQSNYNQWWALVQSGSCAQFLLAFNILKDTMSSQEPAYRTMLELWMKWDNLYVGDCRRFWQDLGSQHSAIQVFSLMPPQVRGDRFHASFYDEWRALATSGQSDKFGAAFADLKTTMSRELPEYADIRTQMLSLFYIYRDLYDSKCEEFWYYLGDQVKAKEVFSYMAPQTFSGSLIEETLNRDVPSLQAPQTDGSSLLEARGNYEEWQALAESGQRGKFGYAFAGLKASFPPYAPLAIKTEALWHIYKDLHGGDCKAFWEGTAWLPEAREVFSFAPPQRYGSSGSSFVESNLDDVLAE